MLSDTEYYQSEGVDRNQEFAEEIRRNVNEMESNKYINNKEKNYLLQDLDNPRTSIFYGLPKIHKLFNTIPLMRPIVSCYL